MSPNCSRNSLLCKASVKRNGLGGRAGAHCVGGTPVAAGAAGRTRAPVRRGAAAGESREVLLNLLPVVRVVSQGRPLL